MTDRAPTDLEKAWWERLQKCLAEMPRLMEIHCNAYGELSAAPLGAYNAVMDAEDDSDRAAKISLPSITSTRIRDTAGSL